MQKDGTVELKSMLTHSSDAFLVSDPKGKILYVNSAIERVTGINVKTHLGRNLRDLLKEGLINHSATLESLKKQKTVTLEVKTIAGKYLLNTASPILDSSGRLEGAVCNIRNQKIYSSQPERELNFKLYEMYSLEPGFPYKLVSIDGGAYEIVVNSDNMTSLIELAVQIGQVDSTVIIYGETGVGKELIARLIHDRSPRARRGAFVKVNCAAFPHNLIESELFGYEEGAFTGALKGGKAGYFEIADKGTLFLDEIAELPMDLQAKLLGVLQDRQVFRIGATSPKELDIRIIAATNRDLGKMVEEGRFREDLYYRLNVIPLEVPPLRERIKDISALFHYFSSKLKKRYALEKEISSKVVESLTRYSWPGNVRELFNMVERLLITVPQKTITLEHLSNIHLKASAFQPPFVVNNSIGPLKEMVSKFEIAVVKKALEQCSSPCEAAEMLGISLSSLHRRLRKLKEKEKDNF